MKYQEKLTQEEIENFKLAAEESPDLAEAVAVRLAADERWGRMESAVLANDATLDALSIFIADSLECQLKAKADEKHGYCGSLKGLKDHTGEFDVVLAWVAVRKGSTPNWDSFRDSIKRYFDERRQR